jgi:hypothetical protein
MPVSPQGEQTRWRLAKNKKRKVRVFGGNPIRFCGLFLSAGGAVAAIAKSSDLGPSSYGTFSLSKQEMLGDSLAGFREYHVAGR